jgi:heme/copper-type cytochrome/quinol oxidase subunit 2
MKYYLIILVLTFILMSSCTSKLTGSKSDKTNQNPTTASSSATIISPIKEFTIEAKNYAFTPNLITVKKGYKVRIKLTSADGYHNFVLDEFNVRTNVFKKGQTEIAEFTPDKIGTFVYYCSIGGHQAKGARGTLTVVE